MTTIQGHKWKIIDVKKIIKQSWFTGHIEYMEVRVLQCELCGELRNFYTHLAQDYTQLNQGGTKK